MALVFGYAVGLDMTRRDLQNQMKQQGRPWEIGKTFEHSAPIGPITPREEVPDIGTAAITLAGVGPLSARDRLDATIEGLFALRVRIDAQAPPDEPRLAGVEPP